MSKQPLVSITLLSYNRPDVLRETLSHIAKIKYPNLETIVVDNDSIEDIPGILKKEFPWVRVIELGVNAPLRGRNVSLQSAKGKYVVLLDDDSYPEPDAISKMVERFESDPLLGMIAFHIPCGDYFTTYTWSKDSAIIGRLFLACGAGIRKETFDKIGYYCDEVLEHYTDEFDFTYRANAAGYALAHYEDIIAHHRTTINTGRWRKFFYKNQRNLMYLMGKYIPPEYWLLFSIRQAFYAVIRAYYLEGIKASFMVLVGCIAGCIYAFRGYRRKVLLPEFIYLTILRQRGYFNTLFRFISNKTLRRKILARMKNKYKIHAYCPQPPESEAEIDKRLLRTPISPLMKNLTENRNRIFLASLRQNTEEQKSTYKFILSELSRLPKKYEEELYAHPIYEKYFKEMEQYIARKISNYK